MFIKKYSFIIYLKLKLYTLFFICITLLVISINNNCFVLSHYYKTSCCISKENIFFKSNKFYIADKNIKSINYLQHIYFNHNDFLYLNNIHLNIAEILFVQKKKIIALNFYKSFFFFYPNNYYNEYIFYKIIKTSLKYINKNKKYLSDQYFIYINKSLIYYYIYNFPFSSFYTKLYKINKYLNKRIFYHQIYLAIHYFYKKRIFLSEIRLKNIILNYHTKLNYIIEATLIKKYNL